MKANHYPIENISKGIETKPDDVISLKIKKFPGIPLINYFRFPVKLIVILFLTTAFALSGKAESPYTFHTHSYIINMGVVPQTIANGLKPYGLIYNLIKNYNIPVYWIIGASKSKDGIDFEYPTGVAYKGGTFIIPDDYITTTVANLISSSGVTGAYTTSNLTLTPAYILKSVPTWTLDAQNGSLAVPYFTNAGLAGVYNWKAPSTLGGCDDVFVMPHADPTWAVHGHLYEWNLINKGSIWLGCHAGSALSNTYNPADISQQMNFLVDKISRGPLYDPVPNGTAYCENSLVLWTHHTTGSIPYNTLTGTPPNGTIATAQDPVAQYMGITDLAQLNGSEQVYLPVLGGKWSDWTKIICWDPTQVNVPSISPGTAVIIAYGRAFGDDNRGYVMFEACHSLNKGTVGDVPAQRAFFNWSFIAMVDKTPVITSVDGIPPDGKYNALPFPQNYPLTVHYSFPTSSGLNSVKWSITRSDNGLSAGDFVPNNSAAAATTQFTPKLTTSDVVCNLSVLIVDNCNRSTFATYPVTIKACNFTASAGAITNLNCYNGTNGSVALVLNGGIPNYTWSWTRTEGGTGSGSGTTVSPLAAGTYSITVTDGSGCTSTFSALVTQPAQLVATPTVTEIQCNGGTGSISLAVTGGTSPYTFAWGDGPVTQNRTGLASGAYSVTVTDSKGCQANASATVQSAPAVLNISGSQTNVHCHGEANGTITPSVSGGTPSYTWDWTDVPGTINDKDRTGLAAGTYGVKVTDAHGCITTKSFTITQPDALSLSTVLKHETCPGDFDGTITLTVIGGTSPFNFDWLDVAGTNNSQNRSGLTAGTYTVNVTDFNGCPASTSAIITTLKPDPVTPGQITK